MREIAFLLSDCISIAQAVLMGKHATFPIAKMEVLGSGLLDEQLFGVGVCTHGIKDNLCPNRHVLRKLPGFIFRVCCFDELAVKRLLY